MTLPPFHPFSLEYTANPKAYFADFHRDNRLVFIPDMNAVAVHGYDAVRAFCDHPQMSRNPSDAGLDDPKQAAIRMKRWPTLEGQMRRTVAGDQQGLARMREMLAPDFKPAMIRKISATVTDVVEKVCAPLQWEREIDMVSLVQAVPLMVMITSVSLARLTTDERDEVAWVSPVENFAVPICVEPCHKVTPTSWLRSAAVPVARVRPIRFKLTASLVERNLNEPSTTPEVPPAARAVEGDEESSVTVSEPVPMVII